MADFLRPRIVRDIDGEQTVRSLVLDDVAQDLVRAIIRAWPVDHAYDPGLIQAELLTKGRRMQAEDKIAVVVGHLKAAGVLAIPLHADDCEALRGEADEAALDYETCRHCHTTPARNGEMCDLCEVVLG